MLWSEFIYGFPGVVKYLLSLSALVIIVVYRLANPAKPSPGKLISPVILIFAAWTVFLLISVILNPHSELWPGLSFMQRMFGQSWFFIPYFVPLLLLYSKFDLDFFSLLFRVSSVLVIPGILVQLYTFLSGIDIGAKEQQYRLWIFDICCSFLLLSAHISKRKYLFSIALLFNLLMVVLFAQFGRRAITVDYIMVMTAAITIRLRSVFLNFNDRAKVYFSALLLVIIILLFGHVATSSYVFERGFTKDAFEASRGDVFEGFFLDFNTISDITFGRGIGGTILRSANNDDIADFIESGILILLFKGGLLYLIPCLLILLRAAHLGLYRSNNDLVKALAIFILIYIISLYALNWPEFSSKYVFLWVCVSACFSEELRKVSNEEIYRKLNSTGRMLDS